MPTTFDPIFYVLCVIFIVSYVLTWAYGKLTAPSTFEDGYKYGMTMADHPADRAEAESHVEYARAVGEFNEFDRGVLQALDDYPHGLPRP